jgi:hypothetical protein
LPRILPVRVHAETRASQLIANHPHLVFAQALNVIQTKLIPDWEVDSGQNGLFLERVGKPRNQSRPASQARSITIATALPPPRPQKARA